MEDTHQPAVIDANTSNVEQAAVWTIGRLLNWTAAYLTEKRSEYPRLDAEVLLAHTLGCRRIELYTRHSEKAPEEARTRFKELIRRRVEGCPVAYLVGRKEFFSLEFEVTPAVLIPRPDTECVVLECLRLAKYFTEPAILDLGTGSGNIAVAVAHQLKSARVSAVDASQEALGVAQRNAKKHGVSDHITFLQGNLFEPVSTEGPFDFILSNPPYIPSTEIANLPIGVHDYEPHVALDGGADGFAVFDRIVDQARTFLKPGGYLILEIGAPQEIRAREKLGRIADYDLGPTIPDGAGHPRVLRARSRL
ncbi:MAG: peptide chain release factor N(5)-glutamine methyltransferase [Gemmataceae bacterium]